MRGVYLTLAAAAAISALPAPASAERRDGFSTSRSAASAVRIHRGHGDERDSGKFDDFRRDGDRDRRFRGDAYLPYRDYQGDSLWRADSFNDWWHDRPDRAFPRWVHTNQDCQRRYWAGGAWRC